MKSKITLSIALVLSVVLLSLMSSDSTANAAPPQRATFDTGVLSPAAGQTLRIAATGADGVSVRFGWTQYGAPDCSGTTAVCRHAVVSQDVTPVAALGDDALSFDVPGDGNGVRVVVESNSKNVRVNGMIIDPAGQTIVIFDITGY